MCIRDSGYVVDRPAGVAANLQNRVALLQGCGACGVLAEIRNRRAADLAHGKDEHQQHRDAEDKVHQRTAERDKKALPGGGILKFLAADDQREKQMCIRDRVCADLARAPAQPRAGAGLHRADQAEHCNGG